MALILATSHDETSLAEWIHRELGHIAISLAWEVAADDYRPAMVEAVRALNATELSGVTGAADIHKLEQFALYFALVRAARQAAGRHSFSADGGTYNLDQLRKMIAEARDDQLGEVMGLGYAPPGYSVEVGRVTRDGDPYNPPDVVQDVMDEAAADA